MTGSGRKALVFGHGFGLDQLSWRYVIPHFEAAYRIVTFDYVGCGASDRTAYDAARYATLEGYAQDLLDVLGALELQAVSFIGASVSGMIGLLAALRAPARIAALVMIGSSARYIDDPPSYRGGFQSEDVDGLIRMMDDNFIGWASNMAHIAIKEPSIASELEQNMCAIDPRLVRQFAAATFRCDLRSVLPRCTQPVLVVQCAYDDVVPNTAATYLAEHLPHARLQLLPAAGHCPQLTQPRALSHLIAGFIADLEQPT